MTSIKVFWFGISGVLLFILSTVLGGFQFSSYSHISQLISESYAIDTPYGIYLRFFGFIPSGLFIALFSFYALKFIPKSTLSKIGFYGIGIFYGFSTVLVSLFPCDEGCNKELIDPSSAQLIHNLSGLLTYMIVPICLILIGFASKKWTDGKLVSTSGFICGILSILFVVILSADLKSEFAGLYQRIIEGSVLFWIAACSFYFRKLIVIDSK